MLPPVYTPKATAPEENSKNVCPVYFFQIYKSNVEAVWRWAMWKRLGWTDGKVILAAHSGVNPTTKEGAVAALEEFKAAVAAAPTEFAD